MFRISERLRNQGGKAVLLIMLKAVQAVIMRRNAKRVDKKDVFFGKNNLALKTLLISRRGFDMM